MGGTGGATSRELGLDGWVWSALGAQAKHPGLAAFLGVCVGWGGVGVGGQRGAHLKEGPLLYETFYLPRNSGLLGLS